MRILFIGDIVGRPGRRITKERLAEWRRQDNLDLIVANGENAAGGAGLTPAVARELFDAGIDVLTLGDHAWDKRELIPEIDNFLNLLRPANFPPGTPGRGGLVVRTRSGCAVGVLSLMCRVYMGADLEDPFRVAEEELARLKRQGAEVVLVDVHGEATSEKVALGWYLDGRVTAVLGTHTHVQTADAWLLPGGTAYMTDVGFTGPWQSVIGVDSGRVIEKFLTQMPVTFEVAKGPSQFNAVLIEADPATGQARSIQPIFERERA